MNWIKQEHFTASASLHGVIIPSLSLLWEIILLPVVIRPLMFLWSMPLVFLVYCHALFTGMPQNCALRVPKKVICSKDNILQYVCLWSWLLSTFL
jgi:hypothetical protein